MTKNQHSKNDELLLQVQIMSGVLDNIGCYVYSKDLAGNYTYVNADVAELFQTPIEDIIGKDDSLFFDLEVSHELRQNDLKVIHEKAPVVNEESNVVKSTGEVLTYKTIKKPIFDDTGKVIGISGISMDITAQKALEAENQEQKKILDVILDNVDAHIYMKDSKRHFRYVNNQVAELFGLPAEEIIGKRDIDIMPRTFADELWQTDKLVFETNNKIVSNETLKDADDNLRHYLSAKVPCNFQNDKDNDKTLIGFSTDVTELYQLKEKFEQLANHDELTGLFNRRYFFDNANREFKRIKRYPEALAVISIDVDHFKAVNDQYGHLVGDQVLIKIAQLITPTIRAEDIFARIGGEEFSILQPNTTKLKSQQAAERLRQLLDNNPITLENNIVLPIKVSLGVSMIKDTDTCFQDLYARSDVALYKAKACGRNHVCTLD